MQSEVVLTFPDILPRHPWNAPIFSTPQKGPDGTLGIIFHPATEIDDRKTACTFFEIDLRNKTITHQSTHLPSSALFQMQSCYDWTRERWVVALREYRVPVPLAVYEIPQKEGHPWTLLFTADSIPREFATDIYLTTFWQQGESFPLLFEEPDSAQMYDAHFFWTHWRASTIEQPIYQHLGSAYACLPSISEAGCLLLTCECLYDQEESDPVYQKKGSGQWQLIATTYTHTGQQIQRTLPGARGRATSGRYRSRGCAQGEPGSGTQSHRCADPALSSVGDKRGTFPSSTPPNQGNLTFFSIRKLLVASSDEKHPSAPVEPHTHRFAIGVAASLAKLSLPLR